MHVDAGSMPAMQIVLHARFVGYEKQTNVSTFSNVSIGHFQFVDVLRTRHRFRTDRVCVLQIRRARTVAVFGFAFESNRAHALRRVRAQGVRRNSNHAQPRMHLRRQARVTQSRENKKNTCMPFIPERFDPDPESLLRQPPKTRCERFLEAVSGAVRWVWNQIDWNTPFDA